MLVNESGFNENIKILATKEVINVSWKSKGLWTEELTTPAANDNSLSPSFN